MADLISFYLATLIDGEPIIKLPPKLIHMSKVDFTAEEQAFYTQLEADSCSKFKVPFFCIFVPTFKLLFRIHVTDVLFQSELSFCFNLQPAAYSTFFFCQIKAFFLSPGGAYLKYEV